MKTLNDCYSKTAFTLINLQVSESFNSVASSIAQLAICTFEADELCIDNML